MHASWCACCALGLRLAGRRAGASREKILRDAWPSLMSQPTPRDSDKQDSIGTEQDCLVRYQDCKSGILFARYRGLQCPQFAATVCVVSLAYVCLSYVEPSCGKTFAYLRFSIREKAREAQKSHPLPSASFAAISLVCRCPWIVVDFSARSVILRLSCLQNETFLKNARYILSPLPLLLFLPFCPAGINWLSNELNLSDGPALSNAPT